MLGMRLGSWICFPGLLNCCVCRECLLVLETGKWDELGEGRLEEKIFVMRWHGIREERESRCSAIELGMTLGVWDLRSRRGEALQVTTSLAGVAFELEGQFIINNILEIQYVFLDQSKLLFLKLNKKISVPDSIIFGLRVSMWIP